MKNQRYFASCPRFVEDLLEKEVRELGGEEIKVSLNGIYFTASLETAYKVCLWSRIANRVYLMIHTFTVEKEEDIYTGGMGAPWDSHFDVDNTFLVTSSLSQTVTRNSAFTALKLKDGIADYFREKQGIRPNVDTENADIRVYLRINKTEAFVGIDFAGESLHMREYRVKNVPASLKENIAAAVLMRAGWPEIAANGGALVDPMCGSGTLAIEAAYMAGGIAPGLRRSKFGFMKWKGHDIALWDKIVAEAVEKESLGFGSLPDIHAWDIDRTALRGAKENIDAAGLSGFIKTQQRDFCKVKPSSVEGETGLVVINPPYGERLGEIKDMYPLYEKIGERLVTCFSGWKSSIITGDEGLARAIALRASRVHKLYNGKIECTLAHFDLTAGDSKELRVSVPENIKMLKNRLQKNMKNLESYLRDNNVTCYRIYDADIPEYAAAIDIYDNTFIHLQEYAPPSEIDRKKAQKRLGDIVNVLPELFNIKKDHIFVKQRRRQKGSKQYDKMSQRAAFETIREGGLKFQVNFTDYLDTGIFLDHRITRDRIRQISKGKKVLNLFSYTGTATVYAVAGGAQKTVSVDASATYLAWMKRNLKINNFDPYNHYTIKADVIAWLKEARDRFDVIFIDPPTFSNSKSRHKLFDIQRDYGELINLALKRLYQGGTIVFSTNFRKFKFDPAEIDTSNVKEITEDTLPPDFKRRKIHRAWEIRR